MFAFESTHNFNSSHSSTSAPQEEVIITEVLSPNTFYAQSTSAGLHVRHVHIHVPRRLCSQCH